MSTALRTTDLDDLLGFSPLSTRCTAFLLSICEVDKGNKDNTWP